MSELIDRQAFIERERKLYCEDCDRRKGMKNGNLTVCYDIGEAPCRSCWLDDALTDLEDAPTIEAVPVKFIDEVIEYLTKCRDYAIHEETKTSWDEQRQTLIILLHEWAAWNECGRTGKYGERREG